MTIFAQCQRVKFVSTRLAFLTGNIGTIDMIFPDAPHPVIVCFDDGNTEPCKAKELEAI